MPDNPVADLGGQGDLTVKQTADRLHLSVASVYRLVHLGELVTHRVGPCGKKMLIAVESIEEYWDRCFRRDKEVQIGDYKHLKLG
jgi:excisionase family DNA binding protein